MPAIEAIRVHNLFGAADVVIEDVPGVLLLAGPNGSGKSSVVNAIGLAYTGRLARVELKKEGRRMIHDGAKSGTVTVEYRGGEKAMSAHVTATVLRSTGEPVYGGSPIAAACLGAIRLGELPADKLRAALLEATGAKITAKAVRQRLIDRGRDVKAVDSVVHMVSAGWEPAQKACVENASQARGAWKTITGEVYGSEKAETWSAGGAADAPTDDEVARLGRLAQSAQAAFDQADLRAREAVARLKVKADAATAVSDTDRADAARLPELEARWAEASAASTAARAEADARAEERRRLDQPEPSLRERMALALMAAAPHLDPLPDAPSQQAHAQVVAVLQAYEQQFGSLPTLTRPTAEQLAAAQAAADSAAAKAGQAAQAAQEAKMAADAAREAARRVHLASDPPTPEEFAAAEQAAAQAEAAGVEADTATAAYNNAASLARLAKEARERTEKAADAHANVKLWVQLADDMSPGGVPAELLAEAVKPLSNHLAWSAVVCEWPAVTFADDMSPLFGGRPYPLLSESEKWRVDAMLAAAVARVSRFGLLVLDRMDLVQPDERGAVIDWADQMVGAGDVDNVLIAATLASAPSIGRQTMPGVRAHWIESGTCRFTPDA